MKSYNITALRFDKLGLMWLSNMAFVRWYFCSLTLGMDVFIKIGFIYALFFLTFSYYDLILYTIIN